MNPLVLVLVLVRDEKAVQALGGHLGPDQGKVLAPEGGIGGVVEGLAHGRQSSRCTATRNAAARWEGMSDASRERIRLALRLALACVYAPIGILHLRAARAFLPIMPPQIPLPQTVIELTGVCEIAGAVGLMIPRTRKAAGVALALYALCVWPANIYHAVSGKHVPPLPDSWWYHGPRLAFQPVFVWWALFAGGMIDWPWRRRSEP